MAIITNGYSRSLTVKVDELVNGTIINPNDPPHDGKLSFTHISGRSYVTITSSELQLLSLADYNTRLADYIDYVNAIYGSVVVTSAGARYANNIPPHEI